MTEVLSTSVDLLCFRDLLITKYLIYEQLTALLNLFVMYHRYLARFLLVTKDHILVAKVSHCLCVIGFSLG